MRHGEYSLSYDSRTPEPLPFILDATGAPASENAAKQAYNAAVPDKVVALSSAFEVGELVHLNSGSPALTVERLFAVLGGGVAVGVVWFDAIGEMRREVLPEECLKVCGSEAVDWDDEDEEDEDEDEGEDDEGESYIPGAGRYPA